MNPQASQNSREFAQDEMTGLFTFLQEQYRKNWTSVDQDHVPGMSSNSIFDQYI
jgi:hypothetical protein